MRDCTYTDRGMAKKQGKPLILQRVLGGGAKRVLLVLFVPSVERDGQTPIDQKRWVEEALEMLGRVLGAQQHIRKRRVFGGTTKDQEFS